MKEEFQIWQTDREGKHFLHNGKPVQIPEDWVFVPSGDPGLTRRLKALGEYYTVVHRRKNRIESLGLWTKGTWVEAARRRLESERATPQYQHKLEASRKLRETKQNAYVLEFRKAVLKFLDFAPCYSKMASVLADAVTAQTVPVGSGTVARTERIPLSQRAEAAVIAWMRHQTTAYDHMSIARIKGERREVRRHLAEHSRTVLQRYREGLPALPECPLAKALKED